MRIEIAVVLAVTFGLSAYAALLNLIEAVLLGLAGQRVALNPRRSPFDLIDLGLNLAVVFQLVAWGALGVYLLWRSGVGPTQIGLGRVRWRPDVLGGLGLAALIGLPGLGLYVAARALGLSAHVEPAELYDSWWRIPVLLITAFANGWAEEVIVVAFLLTRLRQLRVNPVAALLASSLLRGAYHLYQGFGAGTRQRRDGPGIRLRVATHRPAMAVGHRARDHRLGRLRRLRAGGRATSAG